MNFFKKCFKLAFIPYICFSCANKETNSQNIDINIIEQSNQEGEEIIENVNLTQEQQYIKKYYEFYLNYQSSKTKLLNVDITGKIDNTDFTIDSIYVDVLNRVIINFTCGSKSFDLVGAGMEWDVTTAYLESFVIRCGNPSFTITNDEIDCVTTKPGLEGQITNMSYYSTGYIKSLKATFYYENFKVYYDLNFNNWRE